MMRRVRPTILAVAAFCGLASCATEPAGPVDFDVEPASHTLMVGETVQLTASGAPGPVTWSSSNATVATVAATTGLVTATGAGTVTITAVSGASYASANLTVNPNPALENPFSGIAPIFSTPYAGFTFTPCTNCHTPLSGSNTERYNWLIPHVTPGNPNAGKLICKITSGTGCGTPMPLPAAQVQKIRDWIAAGAPR